VRRSRFLVVLAVVLTLVAAVATSGCRRVKLAVPPGGGSGASDWPEAVPLGAATSVDATVRMAIGGLTLSATEPSSTLALDGSFNYSIAGWKPRVTYSIDGTRGVLSVVQPEMKAFRPTLSDNENSWNVKLAAGVPTDLSLALGLGDSDVDLRGLDIDSLRVVSGVGQTRLDLSGPRSHDVRVRVDSGVGDVEIDVPSDVGVRLVGGKDGVGDLSASGFTRSGAALVNSAWGKLGPQIDISLTRGVGDINVTSE
jgi:hypothetical protein